VSPDPERVASTVAQCPSVVELSGGPFGTVATYLPGRRVTGVRIDTRTVEVHVIGKWGVPVPALASEIRSALVPVLDGERVAVVVEDIAMPAGEENVSG
jgi:uncharacterized alkaline shock family protein YloU